MELETFREETRDWLETNCPQEMRLGAIHFEDAYEVYRTDAAIEWRDRAVTRGWTAPRGPARTWALPSAEPPGSYRAPATIADRTQWVV